MFGKTEPNSSSRASRLLLTMASLAVITWGIYQAKTVVTWLLVSIFLAGIGIPPLLWMQRRGIPAAPAVLIVVAAMVGLLLSIGAVAGPSIHQFSAFLPYYQERLDEQIIALDEVFARFGLEVPHKLLLKYADPGALMSLAAGLLSGLASLLSNIVLILITATFILLEASTFPLKVSAAFGSTGRFSPAATKFAGDFKRYVAMQSLISLATGVLVALWLYILGVDFPVLWGLLAFVLNYVPYLGAVAAAVPAISLALLQFGIAYAVYAAAGYGIIFFVIGNVVQPWLMGKSLGLSTLVVFVSLVLWGNLLGIVGVILAIPITMALKIALESSDETRWLGVLLGPEPSPEEQRAPERKEAGAGAEER